MQTVVRSIVNFAKSVLRRNRKLDKTVRTIALKMHLAVNLKFRKHFILVYSVGKVGSGTIYKSLRESAWRGAVYHVHYVTQEGLDDAEKQRSRVVFRGPGIVPHAVVGQFLYERLQRGLSPEKLKIVTSVRDPVAGEISSFFENLMWHPDFDLQKIGSVPDGLVVTELLGLFSRCLNDDSRLFWFDRELKRALQVDAYATPFPKSRGFLVYRGPHPDTLVLKLEKMNQCAEEAFKEFLGLEHFSLKLSNLASEKKYHNLYQKFRESVRFSEAYLDKMYSSQYARHFYTEEEIHKFRKRWSGREDDRPCQPSLEAHEGNIKSVAN